MPKKRHLFSWMLFVGFFCWSLLNGTAIAGAIVESFAKIGDQVFMVLVLLVILLALATIATHMLVTLRNAWLLVTAGQLILAAPSRTHKN